MPLPPDLSSTQGQNAHLQVWSGTIGVDTANAHRTKNKTFTSFVEIFEQTAHDPGLNKLAQGRKIEPRRLHKGRVAPLNPGTDNVAYYASHGEEAAKMASEWITEKWQETVGGNANTWWRGKKQTLTWQSQRRGNGYSYEVTLWYYDTEVYVAFHCYKNT